jgi:hypothetical protein
MQVIVPFISPEVFRAWESFSEQSKDSQERVTRNLLVNFLELSRIDPLLALEAHFQYLIHVVHSLTPLLEVVKATTFLSELAFDSDPTKSVVLRINHR